MTERVTLLKKMIEDAPKSLGWKMRARVGERVQWYELPEADKEVVDSRIAGGPAAAAAGGGEEGAGAAATTPTTGATDNTTPDGKK